MFDDIFTFIVLVQSGSFSKAAKNLGIHQSTISRKIELLESKLQFKVIQSVEYGKIKLTEDGKSLYSANQANYENITASIESIYHRNNNLHGDFYIVVPALLNILMGPVISQFVKAHPSINLHMSNFNGDMASYNLPFDVSVSFLTPSNPNFIIHSAYCMAVSLYASAGYIKAHGTPTNFQDLNNHQIIVAQANNIRYLNWQALNTKTKKMEQVSIQKPKGSFDGAIAGKFLCLADQGIVTLPDLMVREEIANKTLVRVLPDYTSPGFNIQLVKSDRNFCAKSDAFIALLKQMIPSLAEHFK